MPKFKIMKEFYVIKPQSLSIEDRIKKNKPNFEYNLDYFYFLVGYIMRKSTYIAYENEQEDVWVGLCSDILKRYPYNYDSHIRYLTENFPGIGNVLYRQNYSKGRCYSYRLSPSYFHDSAVTYKITDKKLLKRIRKNKPDTIKFCSEFRFLVKYFESGKLKIDINNAVVDNNKIFENSLKMNDDILKQKLNAIQIIDVANQDYKLTYSKYSDGRIHSVFTRLSKKLRKHLTYDGHKLAEVDISASVPTFMFYILREISSNKNPNHHLITIFKNLEKSCSKNNYKLPYHLLQYSNLSINSNNTLSISHNNLSNNVVNSNHSLNSIHYMSEKSPVSLNILEKPSTLVKPQIKPILRENSNQYIIEKMELFMLGEKILNGSFYNSFESEMHTIHHFDKNLKRDQYLFENVKKELGHDFDGDTNDIRKMLKKRILSMLNAKPAKYLNEEAMFNMFYPSILRWLKAFKRKNHKIFSYLTLQTESHFMLDIVARQFNKKYNGKKPLFTIHDCLVTTENNLEELYHFMKETLSEELKFEPVLKNNIWK